MILSTLLIPTVVIIIFVHKLIIFNLDKKEVFKRGYEMGIRDAKIAEKRIKAHITHDEYGRLHSTFYLKIIVNKENWEKK